MSVDAVEAALRIGESEIADEALLDPVVLEPEDSGVFGMSFDAAEELNTANTEGLVIAKVIPEEALL